MSIIRRGIVFAVGTVSMAVLFLVHSRVVLEIMAVAETFPSGPATGALQLLPMAIQIAIGGIELGLILYFLGGLQEERTVSRGPV